MHKDRSRERLFESVPLMLKLVSRLTSMSYVLSLSVLYMELRVCFYT